MNGHSNGPREGFAEDSEDEEESDEEGEEEGEFTTTAAQTSSYGKEVKGLYRVDDVLPEEEFGEITVAGMFTSDLLSLGRRALIRECLQSCTNCSNQIASTSIQLIRENLSYVSQIKFTFLSLSQVYPPLLPLPFTVEGRS